MERSTIILCAVFLLVSVNLSYAKPLDEEVLIERYYRSLRDAATEFVPDVEEEDDQGDPGVNETFWMDEDYLDEDNETPALSISFADLGGLEPSSSVNFAKTAGKETSSSSAWAFPSSGTTRVGKNVLAVNSSAEAATGFDNKIPSPLREAKGIFRQLISS